MPGSRIRVPQLPGNQYRSDDRRNFILLNILAGYGAKQLFSASRASSRGPRSIPAGRG